MPGRVSTRGDCSQPGGYRYALKDKKRPGEFYPIEEDGRGTYIMNSRDLCLIRRIRELSDAGVASLKIEGRMKSEYYVGGVVNAYRRALDGLQFDYIAELEKTAHRPFTAGFTFGDKDTQFTASAAPQQTHKIAAVVVSASAARTDTYTVKQKNKFTAGEELEILSPSDTWNKTFTVDASSNIPEQTVEIHCPYPLRPNDILRKKVHSQC
jgi:putative protease